MTTGHSDQTDAELVQRLIRYKYWKVQAEKLLMIPYNLQCAPVVKAIVRELNRRGWETRLADIEQKLA